MQWTFLSTFPAVHTGLFYSYVGTCCLGVSFSPWGLNPILPLSSLHLFLSISSGFPGGSDGKVSACNAGDTGLIPGSWRSPGEGNGNPLQDFCLENCMDGGAWRATAHGGAKSQTWLSDFTLPSHQNSRWGTCRYRFPNLTISADLSYKLNGPTEGLL